MTLTCVASPGYSIVGAISTTRRRVIYGLWNICCLAQLVVYNVSSTSGQTQSSQVTKQPSYSIGILDNPSKMHALPLQQEFSAQNILDYFLVKCIFSLNGGHSLIKCHSSQLAFVPSITIIKMVIYLLYLL
jgi:hypothetical protein